MSDPEQGMDVWHCGDLRVLYRPHLDGGGTWLADPFVRYIRRWYPDQTFQRALEWGAGPGFIGFALLEEGLCDHLTMIDISAEAIECALATIASNGLEDRVTAYVSDNFDDVPSGERFDLVFANPPNYCSINPDHPTGATLIDDLRPHDPGWATHRRFYSSVADYLTPGAPVLLSEVEPFATEVHIPPSEPIPYDRRPGPPADDFREMIGDGGLLYEDIRHYTSLEDIINLWIVHSRAPDA